MNNIKDGIWPTMLTPFTEDNKVDYPCLKRLVDWYIDNGADGLFSICQSSEMFFLSEEEKLEIIDFVLKASGGRVPVIASGHTEPDVKKAVETLKKVASSGVEALVLISNLLIGENGSEEDFKRNVEYIMKEIPDIPLGIYECPYPFKYVVPPHLLKWCADTGRFKFLKDTCCDINIIEEKLKAVDGTGLKIFNANCATLLDSLRLGASGFSGVMVNFNVNVYKWLFLNRDHKNAQDISDLLALTSLVEHLKYPRCAKYYLGKVLGMTETVRVPLPELSNANYKEIDGTARILNNWQSLIN